MQHDFPPRLLLHVAQHNKLCCIVSVNQNNMSDNSNISPFTSTIEDAIQSEMSWDNPPVTVEVCASSECDELIEIDLIQTLGHNMRNRGASEGNCFWFPSRFNGSSEETRKALSDMLKLAFIDVGVKAVHDGLVLQKKLLQNEMLPGCQEEGQEGGGLSTCFELSDVT